VLAYGQRDSLVRDRHQDGKRDGQGQNIMPPLQAAYPAGHIDPSYINVTERQQQQQQCRFQVDFKPRHIKSAEQWTVT